MGCNCGKPACAGNCGDKSPAVLQINNPAEYISFHRVNIPASLGDDKEFPPAIGKYRNVILHYEKNGAVYLYSTDGIPTKLTYEEDIVIPEKPYSSLRRLGSYIYEITFDKLPEYKPFNIVDGACSSFVSDGKLYRNFDWHYDEAPTFVVKCKGFTGIANGDKLADSSLDDDLLAQLPYRIVDGYNDSGIMMSTHVLFNDWDWNGCGNKTIQLQKLPYLVLNKVKSMSSIASDLADIISNLSGLDSEYLLQLIITDGETTYALLPPQNATDNYELVNITSNPKLTNFRWVSNSSVERNASYMQNRPTGVERWNDMTKDMAELRFTKAYESNARLSEFIGINGTTKASSDSALQAIYDKAHSKYLSRTRNGELWQTVHSVVYSKNGMEHLYAQENWSIDYASNGSINETDVIDIVESSMQPFVESTDERISDISEDILKIKSTYGVPSLVKSPADMTDTSRLYVYVGEDGGGLVKGHWYFYGDEGWTDGVTITSSAAYSPKSIAFMGDSITAGNNCSKAYHMYLHDITMQHCLNYGCGGTGFVKTDSSSSGKVGGGIEGVPASPSQQSGNNTIGQVIDTVPENIVDFVVFAGTNDYGANIAMSQFEGAVQAVIDKLYQRNTNFMFVTPIRRNYNNVNGETPNSVGFKLSDYVNKIIELCEENGVRYVDAYHDISLNPNNSANKTKFMPDGLHPNNEGQKLLARKILNTFKNTFIDFK